MMPGCEGIDRHKSIMTKRAIKSRKENSIGIQIRPDREHPTDAAGTHRQTALDRRRHYNAVPPPQCGWLVPTVARLHSCWLADSPRRLSAANGHAITRASTYPRLVSRNSIADCDTSKRLASRRTTSRSGTGLPCRRVVEAVLEEVGASGVLGELVGVDLLLVAGSAAGALRKFRRTRRSRIRS